MPAKSSANWGMSSRPYMPSSGLIEREKSKAKSVAKSLIAAGMSQRSSASMTRRATSMFSSDIGHAVSRGDRCFPCKAGLSLLVQSSYPDSPAASRAASCVVNA
jgi:hypothetical protein